jgi:endonuclease III
VLAWLRPPACSFQVPWIVAFGAPCRYVTRPAEARRVIAVDIYVDRVTNRWGIVATRAPEGTMVALEALFPQRYDVEIYERLVPFGNHICTGIRPTCSTCPVLEKCRQDGVTSPR